MATKISQKFRNTRPPPPCLGNIPKKYHFLVLLLWLRLFIDNNFTSPTSWSWWDPPEWQDPLASQSLGRAFRWPFHSFIFAFKTILALHLPHSEGSQLLKGEIKREPVSDVSLVVPIHLCSMLCKKYKMFNSLILFRPVPTLGSSSSML